MNCQKCKHWIRLTEVYTNIKESKFGQCKNPKVLSIDFMLDKNNLNKMMLNGKEVIIEEERLDDSECLQNTKITTGESFGCLNFEKSDQTKNEKYSKLSRILFFFILILGCIICATDKNLYSLQNRILSLLIFWIPTAFIVLLSSRTVK